MKKFLKLYLCLLIISVVSISYIDAKPKLLISKKFAKLPVGTHQSELAINNSILYYMINSSNKTTIYAKPILISNSSASIVLDNVDYIPVFKLLVDRNLYSIGHSGDSKMGHNQISLLNKTEKADVNHFGFGTVEFDTNSRTLEFISDPYYMSSGEGKDFYYSYGNTIMNSDSNRIFKFSPNFSSIRKSYTYLLKLPYKNNKNPDKSKYGIISIDNKTKKETILVPGITNMTMGENSIYYWVFDEKKTSLPYSLYKYSLNNNKTTLVCKHNDPDYNIIQIKNKIFFMGNETYTPKKQNETKRNYSTLYMAGNEKAIPLYSNMKRVVSDGKNIAVLFEKKGTCEVRIINKEGYEFAKIMIPVSQTDLAMSKNEIIVWSWKDRIVRYYQLPI